MNIVNELVLIDDDQDFLFLYQELLSDYHFYASMVAFTSFEEAYLHMKTSKPMGLNVVISDLNLTLAKAWDFLDMIEQQSPSLLHDYQYYICSCSSNPVDIRRVKNDPRVVSFLDKPIDFEAFESELKAHSHCVQPGGMHFS